jgi:hypothetical protein
MLRGMDADGGESLNAVATTAVGRSHHLDVNDTDANDSHSDSSAALILTPTPTR